MCSSSTEASVYVPASFDVFVVGYVATKTFTSSLLRATDRWIKHTFVVWYTYGMFYTKTVQLLTGSCCDLTAAHPTLAMDSATHVFASIIRSQLSRNSRCWISFVHFLLLSTWRAWMCKIALQIVSYIFSKIIWCKCFTFTVSSQCLKRHQDPILSILHAPYQFSPNFLFNTEVQEMNLTNITHAPILHNPVTHRCANAQLQFWHSFCSSLPQFQYVSIFSTYSKNR
jgi:hypothetical protein